MSLFTIGIYGFFYNFQDRISSLTAPKICGTQHFRFLEFNSRHRSLDYRNLLNAENLRKNPLENYRQKSVTVENTAACLFVNRRKSHRLCLFEDKIF